MPKQIEKIARKVLEENKEIVDKYLKKRSSVAQFYLGLMREKTESENPPRFISDMGEARKIVERLLEELT